MASSPLAMARAGFRFDSSPGFNKMAGFRFGTSYPFDYAGDASDFPLPLHVPLVIMDSALFRADNLGLDASQAEALCFRLIDSAEAVGGVVTLSWHHGTCDNELYPGWFAVYESCLAYLQKKGAWFSTVRDVGEWWRNHAI
jgi:hypothetical protein